MTSDKVGSMYSPATPHSELQLVMQLEAIDRDCTIPAGSDLRPAGFRKRQLDDLTEEEQTIFKRRRVEEERYGSALDSLNPNVPITSHEADDPVVVDDGDSNGSNAVRIDADGFRIPIKPRTAGYSTSLSRPNPKIASAAFSCRTVSEPNRRPPSKKKGQTPRTTSALAALQNRQNHPSPAERTRPRTSSNDREIPLIRPWPSTKSPQTTLTYKQTPSPAIQSKIRSTFSSIEKPKGPPTPVSANELHLDQEAPTSRQRPTTSTQSNSHQYRQLGSRLVQHRDDQNLAEDDPIQDDENLPQGEEPDIEASHNILDRRRQNSGPLSSSQTAESVVRLNYTPLVSTPANASHRTPRSAFERISSSQRSGSQYLPENSSQKSPWSPKEDEILVRGMRMGYGAADMMKRLFPPEFSRSDSAVRGRMRYLRKSLLGQFGPVSGGDPPDSNPDGDDNDCQRTPSSKRIVDWTPDEVDRIRKAIADGLDLSEVRVLFKDRTYDSVKGKIRSMVNDVLNVERHGNTFPKDTVQILGWTDSNNLKLRRAYREGIELQEAHKRWFSHWSLEKIERKFTAYRKQMRSNEPEDDEQEDVAGELSTSSNYMRSPQPSVHSSASVVIIDSHPEQTTTSQSPSPSVVITRNEQDETLNGQLKKAKGKPGQTQLNWKQDKGKGTTRSRRESTAELDRLYGRRSRHRSAPAPGDVVHDEAVDVSFGEGDGLRDGLNDVLSQEEGADQSEGLFVENVETPIQERTTNAAGSPGQDEIQSPLSSPSEPRPRSRATGTSRRSTERPATSDGAQTPSNPSSDGKSGVQLTQELESSVSASQPTRELKARDSPHSGQEEFPERKDDATEKGLNVSVLSVRTVDTGSEYLSAEGTPSPTFADVLDPLDTEQIASDEDSKGNDEESSIFQTQDPATTHSQRGQLPREASRERNPVDITHHAHSTTSKIAELHIENEQQQVPISDIKRRIGKARPSTYELKPMPPSKTEAVQNPERRRNSKSSISSATTSSTNSSSGKLRAPSGLHVFSARILQSRRAEKKQPTASDPRQSPQNSFDHIEKAAGPKANEALPEPDHLLINSTENSLQPASRRNELEAQGQGLKYPSQEPKLNDLFNGRTDKQRWAEAKLRAKEQGCPDKVQKIFDDAKLEEDMTSAVFHRNKEEVKRLKAIRKRRSREKRDAKGQPHLKHREPFSLSGLKEIPTAVLESADEEILREDTYNTDEDNERGEGEVIPDSLEKNGVVTGFVESNNEDSGKDFRRPSFTDENGDRDQHDDPPEIDLPDIPALSTVEDAFVEDSQQPDLKHHSSTLESGNESKEDGTPSSDSAHIEAKSSVVSLMTASKNAKENKISDTPEAERKSKSERRKARRSRKATERRESSSENGKGNSSLGSSKSDFISLEEGRPLTPVPLSSGNPNTPKQNSPAVSFTLINKRVNPPPPAQKQLPTPGRRVTPIGETQPANPSEKPTGAQAKSKAGQRNNGILRKVAHIPKPPRPQLQVQLSKPTVLPFGTDEESSSDSESD